MAQLIKPWTCRNLLAAATTGLKNGSSFPTLLRPVSVTPVLLSDRQYRAKKHFGRCLNQVQVLVEKPGLLDRIFRRLSTKSDVGDLVYQGRIGHLFRILKIFSLTTSSFGLAVQPYLIMTYQNMSLVAAAPIFGTINVFVFMNPLLIHYVAKKYVSELYFDPQSGVFTAVLLTFFARRMNFTFKADDVEVPSVPGAFSMLTAKGKPLFVHEGDFTNLTVYKHLMGFDQPLDITYRNKVEEKVD